MSLWQPIGEALAILVILVLALLALTEYVGARVPGFHTISDAARAGVAHGDYRLFVAVLMLLLLAAAWWPLHVLLRI